MSDVVIPEKIKKGSLYLLIVGERYFVGELIGWDYLYSFAGREKKSKQYLSLVLKGYDEMGIERSNAIVKMFDSQNSKIQIYCTRSLLFSNQLIEVDSYRWMVDSIMRVNKFKLDKRNAEVISMIAWRMSLKKHPEASERTSNIIRSFMRKEAKVMLDEVEKEFISTLDFYNNQLPAF